MRVLKAKLSNNVYRKLFFRKEKDGFGDKDWAEWFTFLGKDITNKQTMDELITNTTRLGLLDMWLTNFAENLVYLRHGIETKLQKPKKPTIHSIAELGNPEESATKKSSIVVGAGPSVWKNNHLQLIADSDYDGYIIATDRMLVPLLEHNIIPYLTVTVDGSNLIKKFYDHPLVKKYNSKIKVALVTSAHPKVVKTATKNGCIIYWFNPMFDVWKKAESYTKILYVMSTPSKKEKGPPLIQCGGNTGTTSWVFSWELLKASPVALVGMDLGYPLDTKLEDTPYFSAILRATQGHRQITANVIPQVYKNFYHPDFKTWAKADYVFQHYRKGFLGLVKDAKPWVETINCTEGGTLFGARIKCMKLEEFLRKVREKN